MTDLVTLEAGVATTTSLIVAEGNENEHASVIRLIRDNLDDFNEVGTLRFEIAKSAGRPTEYAVMDEPASALLMTYLRNNAVVKDFKKRLVRSFYELRAQAPQPLSGAELLAHAVLEAQSMIAAKDARIAVLEPKAEVADKLLEASGDLSVRDAAQVLTRAGIKTGERRLFSSLSVKGWIKRAIGDGRYRPIQNAIEAGWISVIPQSHYSPRTGELVLDPPQIRVTPKGIQKLLVDYEGGVL